MPDPALPRVLLYHAPPSFYSQLVRLCLAEKGVSYETHVALAGPPTFETYEPWYMRLNAGGTVPTLLIDDDSLSDSRDILEGLEARFKEPRLTPINAKQLADMQRWVEISYDLPERILAYGSGRLARLGAMVNAARRRALIKQREKNPDLDELYKDKIEDIDAFIVRAGRRVGKSSSNTFASHHRREVSLAGIGTAHLRRVSHLGTAGSASAGSLRI